MCSKVRLASVPKVFFPSARNDTLQKLTKEVKVSQAAAAYILIIHLLRCHCKTTADWVLFSFLFSQLCEKIYTSHLNPKKRRSNFRDIQGHVLIQQFCVYQAVQMANKKQSKHGVITATPNASGRGSRELKVRPSGTAFIL